MASPCIGNTSTVDLYQDGAGILRGNVNFRPQNTNTVTADSSGLVKRPGVQRFGWMPTAANVTDDDLYNTPLSITPSQGFVEYGPRVPCVYAAPFVIAPSWHIPVRVGWEIQATYTGAFNLSTSGITFQLQVSSSGATWYPVKTTASQSATGQTYRWACEATWFGDCSSGDEHNLIFRMCAMAGALGAGESILCQLTQHRYVDIYY